MGDLHLRPIFPYRYHSTARKKSQVEPKIHNPFTTSSPSAISGCRVALVPCLTSKPARENFPYFDTKTKCKLYLHSSFFSPPAKKLFSDYFAPFFTSLFAPKTLCKLNLPCFAGCTTSLHTKKGRNSLDNMHNFGHQNSTPVQNEQNQTFI